MIEQMTSLLCKQTINLEPWEGGNTAMLKTEIFASIMINKIKLLRVPSTRHQTETLVCSAFSENAGEQEWKKSKERLHSTSHSSTPPYIPKQRRLLSESQWTVLSWVTHSDPLSNNGFVSVSDATQNQSYPLLFLNQGGGCVGAFSWIY